MSRTSIFEKRWLDLVFEGKNKAYGAYQLRLENPRTTLLAMLYGILFVGGISGAGFIFSSFGPGPAPTVPPIDNGTVIVVDRIDPPKPPGVEKPIAEPLKAPETKPQSDWRLDPIVSKPTNDIVDPVENPQPKTPENSSATGTTTDAGSENGSGSATGTSSMIPDVPDTTPAIAATLDKRPMFPGGMEKFYQRITNTFETPELYENRDIKIVLSFIIETDGSMTDIKVLSRTDASLEKEAIRVLKSINKKWEPGVKNGKNVRALFTLPILIRPR